MYYAFESVNCTAVAFNTLAEAQAWIARVVPATDLRGAAHSNVNMGYSLMCGWTAGTQAQLLADCDAADVNYKTAAEAEADYAEAIAAGYYDADKF